MNTSKNDYRTCLSRREMIKEGNMEHQEGKKNTAIKNTYNRFSFSFQVL
jgi:hypothetical protein